MQAVKRYLALLTNAFVGSFADEIAAWHMAVVLLLVSAVTGGRLALLQLWPDYAAASDRSNRMVRCCVASPTLKLCSNALHQAYKVLLGATTDMLSQACDCCSKDNQMDLAFTSICSAVQVLANLSCADLLWVSFLPGFSEELLFRGALIPALGAEW